MPLYEMECPAGHMIEVQSSVDARPATYWCQQHQMEAERVISVPVVHTIDSHVRARNPQGQKRTDGGGGYFDTDLKDMRTGKVPYITSLKQKKELLKARGRFEIGPSPEGMDTAKTLRRKSFS